VRERRERRRGEEREGGEGLWKPITSTQWGFFSNTVHRNKGIMSDEGGQ
jgi:hypothetical protein